MFIDLDRVRASRTVRSLLVQARTEALAANTTELLGSIDAALRALAVEEALDHASATIAQEPS